MKNQDLMAATIVAGTCAAATWWWQRPAKLGEDRPIFCWVIARNESGESNFDGSLREACELT